MNNLDRCTCRHAESNHRKISGSCRVKGCGCKRFLNAARVEFLRAAAASMMEEANAAYDELRERLKSDVQIVHILRYGRALCGTPDFPKSWTPGNWPVGHVWVPFYYSIAELMKLSPPSSSTCPECKEAHSLIGDSDAQ